MSNKKRSLLGTIFKILAIILAVIVFIVGSIYCYLRFALGIDIIDIKNKIDLINKDVSETSLVKNPYLEEDIPNGLNSIFGENSVYSKDENGEAVFNVEEFVTLNLLENAKLTDKQFCALADMFVKQALKGTEQENIADNIQIKQIIFSNLSDAENITSVNMNVIVKFSLSEVKNDLKKNDNVLVDFILNYIPDAIYFTDDFSVNVNTLNNSYTTSSNYFVINQLSKQQSKEIVNLVDKFFAKEKSMIDEIHETIIGYLFGSEDKSGLINTINNVSGFNFEQVESTIYLMLKKA